MADKKPCPDPKGSNTIKQTLILKGINAKMMNEKTQTKRLFPLEMGETSTPL